MEAQPGAHVVILLSGGIDSAALLEFYRERGSSVRTVYVDYGQPAGKAERRSAAALSKHFGFGRLATLRLGTALPRDAHGEYFGRNLLLILLAAAAGGTGPVIVAAGVHAGTRYFDCSEAFAELARRVLDGYSGGRVALDVPFLTWSKQEIVEYCRARKVPLELTHSCEMAAQPCGACPSCLDRRTLGVE